jgi:hypothetical protein
MRRIIKKTEEVETEQVREESEARKEYRRIIEAYAITNPVKFAEKKEALLAKLETL